MIGRVLDEQNLPEKVLLLFQWDLIDTHQRLHLGNEYVSVGLLLGGDLLGTARGVVEDVDHETVVGPEMGACIGHRALVVVFLQLPIANNPAFAALAPPTVNDLVASMLGKVELGPAY